MNARAIWVRDRQFVGESESGHAIVMDTGPGAGGRDTAASPMELLLISLAGCTGIDVVYILGERMKRPVSGVEVRVEAARREEVPRVFTEIDLTYLVRGPGLPEKDALRAIRLSAEKYCSVSAMLAHTATFAIHYELTDESSGEVRRGTLEDVAHRGEG